MTHQTIRRIDRLAMLYLAVAGYIIALLMAIVYWQTDRLLQQERRQSREQFSTIVHLRHEANANDEAARECEAKNAWRPNQ